MYAERGEKIGGADPLTGFAQLILTIWTIIMFPQYAALVAAPIAAIEHQRESWKHLLALPVDRVTIFAAKWITGGALLLLSSLVLSAGVSVAAEILRLMKPAWSPSSLPFAMVSMGTLLSFCAAGVLFSIQMFLPYLEEAFASGKLRFFSSLETLRDQQAFNRHPDPVRNSEWVVYAKPPFAGPQQLVDYVGRYTHRVAISNHRIVDIEGGEVKFTWITAITINRRP
jgi:hypothetical protein